MRRFVVIVALAIVGCDVKVETIPDPEPVSGRVTRASKPVSDVVLKFQPLGRGSEAAIPVKDGRFKGVVVPGLYTYYFAESSVPAAFDAIPKDYRQGSRERTIEIDGEEIEIALD